MTNVSEPMSKARAQMLRESAKELTPEKNLDRANEHTKFVITTVGTIGTLLAGAGGVTAAIAIGRSTLDLCGIPVVPVGALVTSILAGVSVGVALWGRRPNFTDVNPSRLEDVEAWFGTEIDRKKSPVTWSARIFIWSAFAAAITSAIAGILVITSATPRNNASLSTTVGDKGAVAIELGGAVDGVDEDGKVTVSVTTNAPRKGDAPQELISVEVYPDVDGKATLSGKTIAPPGSTSATAHILAGAGNDETWDLHVSFPQVPAAPDPDATAKIASATPAAISLLANYLTTHDGNVPSSITEGLEGLDVDGWVKAQQELGSQNQLGPREQKKLKVIVDWHDADRSAAQFNRAVGTLFVWAQTHKNTIPDAKVNVDGRRLGQWVIKQRQRYASGDLTTGQIALLEAVPGWNWRQPS
ncbi:helicase associated domain-containing protein [Nocardioides ochotonae]|uniref:helicase associated domain-containing protein n=1 Tax=Nocardioides ochotonae TaxID=2685869 RepID=UPI00140BCB71|nr:helicase associated domain-containing protein [Nocardioides ochotonae]